MAALAALWAAPLRAADIITCCDEVKHGGWVAFRKVINLPKAPSRATLRIAADSKYVLIVNGDTVVRYGQLKRGPNRTDTYIDSLSLSNLRAGSNVVYALVWYFASGGYSHRSSKVAGLYFDLDADGTHYGSGADWRARLHPAFYIPSGAKPNARLAESNVGYDARQSIDSAATADYNDSQWDKAVVVKRDTSGWGNFVARPIPMFRDFGVSAYVSSHKSGKKIYCYLPYNAQVSPRLEVEASSGKKIGITSDNATQLSFEQMQRYEYTTRKGLQTFEFPGWINGHCIIYDIPSGVTVKSLSYRESGYDCDLAGSLETSDEELNKLWRKSQRTLYLTMRDNFMDCPDRERAQYIGDVANEVAEVPYALSPSAADLIRKCALEFASWQKPTGELFAPIPSTSWTKELPQQSLAFCATGLWDYYMAYGDVDAIMRVLPSVGDYLRMWEMGSDGLAEYREGSWEWGDWGVGCDMYVLNQAWYAAALRTYSRLVALAGDDAERAWADSLYAMIRPAFNNLYWQGDCYRDMVNSAPADDRAQGVAVVSGLAPDSLYYKLVKFLVKKQNASPYMERFVLQSMCEMNAVPQALTRLRTRYKAMAGSVYTTLWERFTLTSGTTANHAWSGAPLVVLSRYVAGIMPTKPGFAEFQVKPQLCDLGYVRTTVPTIHGNITLYADTTAGYTLRLDVPQGTKASVLLPRKFASYSVNGETRKLRPAAADSTYFELPLQAGHYNIIKADSSQINAIKSPRLQRAAAVVDVYRMDGTIALRGAKRDELKGRLPRGIYIVDGKKVMVE